MQLITIRPHPLIPEWVTVESRFEDAVVAQLKAVPGMRWVPKDKVWEGPGEAARIAARTLEAAKVAKVEWAAIGQQPEDINWHFELPDIGMQLRQYQQEAMSWLACRLKATGAALLADDMGLGKTNTAISTIDLIAPEGIVVILTPPIAAPNWENQELGKWATRFGNPEPCEFDESWNVVTIREWSAAQRRWQVFSYDAFRSSAGKKFLATGPKVVAVILDEIHYLSDPSSQRSKAARELTERYPAAYRLGLTGTPMVAKPADMWHPLDILHPGRWGRKFNFEQRYCNGRYEEITIHGGEKKAVWRVDPTGGSRLDELVERLKVVAIRRTKSEVATEIPPLTRQLIEIDMPREVRKAVAAAAMAATETANGPLKAALSASEESKLEQACELAQSILAGGGRPLLLTHRRDTAAKLGRMLNAPVVNGDTPAAERGSTLQSHGGAGIATIDSVTTAIDLLAFDSVIFVGLDWLPSKLLQAEARLVRIGQQRPVTSYYLIGLGTPDEAIRDRVLARLDTFAAVLSSDETMATTLGGGTEDELIAALLKDVMG